MSSIVDAYKEALLFIETFFMTIILDVIHLGRDVLDVFADYTLGFVLTIFTGLAFHLAIKYWTDIRGSLIDALKETEKDDEKQ